MKNELEKVVKDMAKKARETEQAVEAMQYTQAALNTVNALMTLANRDKK